MQIKSEFPAAANFIFIRLLRVSCAFFYLFLNEFLFFAGASEGMSL